MERVDYSQIVIDFLSEYAGQGLTKAALSRILLDKHPDIFTDAEHARKAIRRYTGNDGVDNRNVIKKRMFYESFEGIEEIPELKTEFIIPEQRVLMLPDIHIPFENREAVEQATYYGKDNGADGIILTGDTFDQYHGSKFPIDPRIITPKDEHYRNMKFLEALRQFFPDEKIYFKIGNHEVRWLSFLMRNAKSFLEVFDFSYTEAYKFNDFNIIEVPEYAKMKLGHLNVIHGHEAGGGISVPVNFARTLWLRFSDNVVAGHSHRSSEHVETNINGKVFGCFSMGCLCSLRPGYRPLGNKWNNGFGFANIYNDGNFKFKNIKIIDGEIY